jgi:2-succinyl-5-enolpyruvyl-6-hydroxy-3-cyclohexene-1-carboxylate synthase
MMQELKQLWAELIIEELVRNNIEMFVLSPGSRSSPLTTSVAGNSRAKTVVHFDERAAAFFALGYARAFQRPAVLICTSGSAVANYFPAVTEAAQDGIPLIILTADRPPELLGNGANQAIMQDRIFGEYAKAFFQIPCPDPAIDPEFVLTTMDQAIYQARRCPQGPVQINCYFREPLEPVSIHMKWNDFTSRISSWKKSLKPYTFYSEPQQRPQPCLMDNLAREINQARRGLLLVGRLDNRKDQQAVRALAEELNWPVFSDITSGLRFDRPHSWNIPYFDQLLLCKKEFPQVDYLLYLGGQFVSKRLSKFLKSLHVENFVRVLNHSFRRDPENVVTQRIEADISIFSHELLSRCESQESLILEELKDSSDLVEDVLCEECENDFHEITLARLLAENIPEGHGLFLASSLAIRHMDMFTFSSRKVHVAANRGASGIDGTVASAVGYAKGLGKPVTLLIGDLALLHDLNSLALLRTSEYPVTVVVVNNDGGGIFSFLPMAKFSDVFTEFFETPHHLNFRHAAEMFSLGYSEPNSRETFTKSYVASLTGKTSNIIEVFSHSQSNKETHQVFQKKIKEALSYEIVSV